jgi:hypothetical protein
MKKEWLLQLAALGLEAFVDHLLQLGLVAVGALGYAAIRALGLLPG